MIIIHRGPQLPPLIPVLYPPLVQHVVAQHPDGIRLHGLYLEASISGRSVGGKETPRPIEFGPDHRPESGGFGRRSRGDVRDEPEQIAVELDGGTLRRRHVFYVGGRRLRVLNHGQLTGYLFNLPATSVSSTFLRALCYAGIVRTTQFIDVRGRIWSVLP